MLLCGSTLWSFGNMLMTETDIWVIDETQVGNGYEALKQLGRQKWKIQFRSVQSLSHVQLFVTPWIAAH